MYKYIMQLHIALGFVMAKYAPDLQTTFDPRLPHQGYLFSYCLSTDPADSNGLKASRRQYPDVEIV